MADEGVEVIHKDEISPDTGEMTHEGTYFTPAVDIYETADEIVLRVDMPGVELGDLDVDIKDDELTIVGKVSEVADVGIELLSEYRVGNYYRNFRISDVVDRGGINATLSDGVLTLMLPKVAKAVSRKIPISVG